MVELIQVLLQMVGLITLIYLFLAWGLSGGLKKFFTFKKKKTDDVNSGAKYGWQYRVSWDNRIMSKKIDYKYNEDVLIKQFKEYVDKTYDQHYSQNKYQATEFIIDGGHGEGFCIGNLLKYAQRYGKKNGYNRADLLKVLHYALMALYVHDTEQKS